MKSLAKEWISTPFYCGKNKGNLEDLCAASLDLHLFPRIFVGLHSWKRIRDCSRTLRQVVDTSFDVRGTTYPPHRPGGSGLSPLTQRNRNGRGIAYEGKRDRQRRTRMNKEFHLQCVRSMLLSLSYERF